MGQYESRDFTVTFNSPTALKEFLVKNFAGQWRILYVPKDASVIRHWRMVGTMAYACGDLLLCIDELGLLCENGQLKRDAKNDDPILEKIIHFGRHRKLNVIATAQRPTDVAMRFRALSTEFRIFQTTEPQDLEYLEKRVGRSTVVQLPGLQKYSFVHWIDSGEVAVVKPQKLP